MNIAPPWGYPRYHEFAEKPQITLPSYHLPVGVPNYSTVEALRSGPENVSFNSINIHSNGKYRRMSPLHVQINTH